MHDAVARIQGESGTIGVGRKLVTVSGLYLFLVIALGIIYCIVLPPRSAPDEYTHYQNAYIYTNYVFGTVSADNRLLEIRETDTAYVNYPDLPNKAVYDLYMEDLANPMAPKDELGMVSIDRVSSPVVPFDYIPQALGIALGRLIGLGFVWTFILGRLFNLALYALVTWYAIRKTPIGKGVFAIAALFPMSLELAGSLSYDAFVISFAFLSAALFLKMKYGEEKARTKDMVIFFFALTMLAPTKGIYATFFLLAFMLPKDRFIDSFRRRWYHIYLALFAVAGATMTLANFFDNIGGSDAPVVTRPVDLYGLSGFLEAPLAFFTLVIDTQVKALGFFVSTMVGSRLGWLHISIPDIIWISFLLLILLAALRKKDEAALSSGDKVGFIVIAAATYLFTMFIFFISWTERGAEHIQGIQGRYITPFLPLPLLALKMKSFSVKYINDIALLLAAAVLNGITLYLAYGFIVAK